MADKYDPYREALVIESVTIWPPDLGPVEPALRVRAEELLHRQAQQAGDLKYVRLHSGFRREITVTPDDLKRIQSSE